MLDFPSLLTGVLVPGLVCGIGLVAIWKPSIRDFPTAASEHAPRASYYALLAGVALFVSYCLTLEVPPNPFGGQRQLGGLDWLLWLALACAPVHLWEAGARSALTRAVAAGAVLALTLRAMTVHHWSGIEACLWLGGLFLLLLSVQHVCCRLNEGLTRASMPLILMLIGTGVSLTVGFNGSARIAQIIGIVCATLGAASLLGLWHEGFRLRRGDVSYAVLLVFGLGVSSFFFSDLPTVDAWLLLSAPLLAWAVAPRVQGWGTVKATLAVLLVTAIPLALASVRGYLTFLQTSANDYDYGY